MQGQIFLQASKNLPRIAMKQERVSLLCFSSTVFCTAVRSKWFCIGHFLRALASRAKYIQNSQIQIKRSLPVQHAQGLRHLWMWGSRKYQWHGDLICFVPLWSQDHRRIQVGRDLKRSSKPSSCSEQGQTRDQTMLFRALTNWGLENLQRWRTANLGSSPGSDHITSGTTTARIAPSSQVRSGLGYRHCCDEARRDTSGHRFLSIQEIQNSKRWIL